MKMNALYFIQEKQDEVSTFFQDWHIQKLASEMEEYAKLYHEEKLNELKDK